MYGSLQAREDYDYEIGRIATVADEHRAWHAVNGPRGCPWDAASCDPDPYGDGEFDDAITVADEIALAVAIRGIPCGRSGHRHPTKDDVRACHQGRYAPVVTPR